MLAELNEYVLSAAPHLHQGWTEAQRRRQGRRSVMAKAGDVTRDNNANIRLIEELLVRAEF